MPPSISTIELVWAAIVFPGLVLGLVTFGIALRDEARRRQRAREHPAWQDPALRITSYSLVIVSFCMVLLHLCLCLIGVVALVSEPRSDAPPPTAMAYIIQGAVIAFSVLFNTIETILLVARWRIAHHARQNPPAFFHAHPAAPR